jgi:hypothetical protein
MAGSWHEGIVIDIKEERGDIVVVVKKTGNDQTKKELKLNSRLLARHKFFTKEPSP